MRNFPSKPSTGALVATPTIDKNGRLTTVHKRAEGASGVSPSLSSAAPSITRHQAGEKQHLIKPKKLSEDSIAVKIGWELERFSFNTDAHEFCDPKIRKAMNMPDDVLYDFLRQGVDTQDAAALASLGISTIDDFPEYYRDMYLPGSLSKVAQKRTISRKYFSDTLDRLQEAGVSAVDADKAISNGLQDGHLDKALSDEQLVQLFSKWKYKALCGDGNANNTEQDRVIDGFVSGLIPIELADKKLNDLKGLEYELFKLLRVGEVKDEEDVRLSEKLQDRDYLTALGRRAGDIEGYRPMRELNRLVEDHGMEVLKLDHPQIAGVKIHHGEGKSTQIGLEGAQYIQTVHRIARESSDRAYWMSIERFSSSGGLEVERSYLRNYELNNLREAGVAPEKAYDMIVNHKLTPEQIIVAHQTGVNDSLAQGAL